MKHMAPRIPDGYKNVSGMLCQVQPSSPSGFGPPERAVTGDESLFSLIRSLVSEHGREKIVEYVDQAAVASVMEG